MLPVSVALGFFLPPIPSDRLWVFAALGMMSFDPVSYPYGFGLGFRV